MSDTPLHDLVKAEVYHPAAAPARTSGGAVLAAAIVVDLFVFAVGLIAIARWLA